MNHDPDILWRRIRDVERHAPADRPRLLVVEDDAETRLHVQYVLRREVRTDVATTAAEAARMARAMAYDGLIIGRRLPDDTGLQLMERLRARPAYQDAPMVAVTDSATSSDGAALQDAGFDACVCRPLQEEVLTALLSRLFGGAPATDGAAGPSGDGLARTEAEDALPSVTAAQA